MSHVAETTASEEARQILKGIATQIGYPIRAPLLKSPKDYGLDFERVSFPSLDGVPLEAWFIPCGGSDKLIIANHPLWFNRYGLPAHMEPWKSIGGPLNAFEVDYVPDYKILHDNGYNVLAYDMRNLGQSGSANGGISSGGRFEARDVLGSIQYARTTARLKNMTIGLFSRCQGCNATIYAMAESPDEFKGIRCMVAPQPLSVRVAVEQLLAAMGLDEHIGIVEHELMAINSLRLDEMSPVLFARHVHIPTLLYQVKDDALTRPEDIREMFENIPIPEKELIWIEGTSSRWDGYLYFQRKPDRMLAWFDQFMS
ncbi:unnamed protein product [Ciceribacter sp. T2.26MG-112.2]|uniref:alpha/beta hydrolase family protein n=1 Tax=Ciceribacter sp. T2.26MG-112.2 TaxID=3137154 RepID=UPI000E15F0A4|nr:alpha/beta hydrolase [Ciceribacter naphthalenivorans]SSC71028.1 unnamed protein product [Ciceribacter naphthalenivorans]